MTEQNMIFIFMVDDQSNREMLVQKSRKSRYNSCGLSLNWLSGNEI